MAFNLISSFSSSLPPITAKTTPLRNSHPKCFLNPNYNFLFEMQTFPRNINALHSLSPNHYNYETESTILSNDVSVENPSKLKIVKRILTELEDPWESLNVIDAIQRLGLDYHFQEEIEAILQMQYATSTCCVDQERDLHKVALHFRLLRQQGYYVPVDVFEIFMDKKGNFDKSLQEDTNGLMSLYEASQLCMQGEEDILEKAGNFTRQILYTRAMKPDHHLTSFVHNTLTFPHYKNVSTFMAKNYFVVAPWKNEWISILQQIAKIDFNATQALHQKEIVQFLQWWKETGLAQESHFARHQPLKWYTSSLVCFTDPSFSEERILLAKSISFVYILDDVFDVYGTLNELTIFTQAICRWDMAATEQLPNCMKLCFAILDGITNEISDTIYQKHGYNPIESLRKAWAKLCKAFLVEAEWFTSGHSPSAQHYLNNGIISSGVPLALEHIFFLLGEGITEETVELLDSYPDIVSSCATILRLWDDLGSAKDEHQDGHDGSYADYYMKEHQGTSLKTTKEHIEKLISNAWKKLNREGLSPNPFPRKFIHASLNIARMVPIAYNYVRDHCPQSLESIIKSVLFQSVDIL